VRTIDEGDRDPHGRPGGNSREDGTYEEGTVNYLVDQRLREMAETMRGFQPMMAK